MDTSGSVNSSRKRRRSFSVHSQSRDSTEGWNTGGIAGIGTSSKALVSSKRLNPKASAACDTCRQKKVKCNEGQPVCNYCETHGFRCDYRLRPAPSSDQVVATLLQRLEVVEEKVEKVESVIQYGATSGNQRARFTIETAFPNTPVETPPPSRISNAQFQLSSDQLWFNLLSEAPSVVDRSVDSYETPVSFYDGAAEKSRYLGKSPFACEEDRALLLEPPIREPVNTSDIAYWLQYYLKHACPLYPVMCDPSAQSISDMVTAQGLGEDIESCFSLLVVAVAKAHQNEDLAESGVSDFNRATQILGRLSTQFKTKFVQAHVLCAIFLLKKGRLLDFWQSLHIGCTMLYTMLKRDEAHGVERDMPDRMNIRRIYWICYSFERDLRSEIDDTLQQSPLHQLQDSLPLPIGCDELDLSNLSPRLRSMLTYFLAEMSLKGIAERIYTTVDLEYYVQGSRAGSVGLSPLYQELRRQLDEWTESVPSCLNWSSEPTKGLSSPLATRVKLMYWFTRFSLLRPLIKRVLRDSGCLIPMLGWTLFREGLHAGHSLIKVVILEASDIDVIMGNRVLSTIYLMQEAVAKSYVLAVGDEDITVLLERGIDALWNQLAGKSEWIKCRIYNRRDWNL